MDKEMAIALGNKVVGASERVYSARLELEEAELHLKTAKDKFALRFRSQTSAYEEFAAAFEFVSLGEVTPAHCDRWVVHTPGDCKYCDMNPALQELRVKEDVNFTGGSDPEKLPCPSELLRPIKNIERWPGNRPSKDGE